MNKFPYDHIVIGWGIVGATIALRLSEEGSKVLCLGEVEGDANSASLAAGAMLGAFGEHTVDKTSAADMRETEFRIQSRRSYPSFLERIHDISGIPVQQNTGTFVISNAAGKDDLQNIEAISSLAEVYAEPAEWVEIRDVPGYRPHRSFLPYRILSLANEASVNSVDLLVAVRTAAQRLGTTVRNARVAKVRIAQDRCVGVELENGDFIDGTSIVLSAGYGCRDLVRSLRAEGLDLPEILGGKGSSLLIRSNLDLPKVIRTPNRDFACGTHVVSRGNGTLYIGATNRISDTPGEQGGVTLGELHVQTHSVIHEINTAVRTDGVIAFRAGARPLTSDGYPLVGFTGISGLHIATGTYRNGILLAPRIADIVASEMLGQSGGLENPFGPQTRSQLRREMSQKSGLRRGVKDLISFIQEPHGLLPYERGRELENFIHNLLEAAAGADARAVARLAEVRSYLNSNTRAEAVPALFYMLAADRNGTAYNE